MTRSTEPALREDAMDVGLQMIFATYGWSNVSDEQAWDEELRLARLAADLGFDVLWSVEHHFNDYSFCPDNIQLMSYLAAECPDVGLGTAAVILPWHDPRRQARPGAGSDHGLRAAGRTGAGTGAPGVARRRPAAVGRLYHREQDVRLGDESGDVRARSAHCRHQRCQ